MLDPMMIVLALTFSVRMVNGIFANINVTDRIPMMRPSSKIVAPCSVINNGSIGRVVSKARNMVTADNMST